MASILLLGLLLGMRHALEADHIAAVASLVSRDSTIGHGVRQGLAWGLGHTITLFALGSLVLFFTGLVPGQLVRWIEFAVGIMLVVLGGDVIRRLIVARIHFHSHSHGPGQRHFHAHSHKGERPGGQQNEHTGAAGHRARHAGMRHTHEHRPGFPVRALMTGLMHGMAGSAALIVLALQTVSSPLLGLVYIALFGIGSIAGMGMFALVIALPLRAARHLTWAYNGLQATIGTGTIALGVFTMVRTGFG